MSNPVIYIAAVLADETPIEVAFTDPTVAVAYVRDLDATVEQVLIERNNADSEVLDAYVSADDIAEQIEVAFA